MYFMIIYILNKFLFDYLSREMTQPVYYIIVAIGTILYFFNQILKSRHIDKGSTSFLIYMFLIIVNGIFLANNDQRPVGIIQYITYPLSLFALLYYSRGYTQWNRLEKFLVAWGGVISILAVIENLTKRPLLPNTSYSFIYNNQAPGVYVYYDGTTSFRASVFQGSPMILAIMLGASFLVSFHLSFITKKSRYKLSALIIVLGILSTGSRAPLLLTFITALILYSMYYKNGLLNKTKKDNFIFIFLILFVLFVILITFGNYINTGIKSIDNIIHRFSSVFNFTSEWGNLERINRWTFYIKRFLNKPFFGYGIASTNATVKTNINIDAHGITTESGVLCRLVETGLIGTCSFYIFIKQYYDKAFKKNKVNSLLFKSIFLLFLFEDIILQILTELLPSFYFYLIICMAINSNHK